MARVKVNTCDRPGQPLHVGVKSGPLGRAVRGADESQERVYHTALLCHRIHDGGKPMRLVLERHRDRKPTPLGAEPREKRFEVLLPEVKCVILPFDVKQFECCSVDRRRL